ncbi:MAG TPA: MEDS domain-containing protein [Terriglobia bacterium]|nr:MEDS domain-containing protein [Terriglobia bacterium]
MSAPLFTRLDGRFPIVAHDHVAVLYHGRPAAFRLASFIAEGLQRGDLCHYLAPASFHAEMMESIRASHFDPGSYVRSQTLRIREGLSDFRALCDQTQQTFADAEHARAPAVRWLEEGSWPESSGFPMQKFFEFHAILNYQVKHYPGAALCQYPLDQLKPDHLFSAIATHRHLLVGETLVRDNPFYIPAEKFIPLSPEERQRDLAKVFREVGFDVEKLLAAIAGYGRLHPEISRDP